MRTLLICHERANLDREGLARWCGSFSTFAGAVVIRERGGRTRTRIAREIGRVGVWRFLDVLAFRLYYRLAQATGDRANVGMTLLRIDKGVDTGPVFGYFRVDADPAESHVVTQHRVVLDHLDAIRDKLLEIEAGTATPIDTAGRKSAVWGQPWLSALLRMRARAKVRSQKSEASATSDFNLHTSDFS